jgi:ATP-dependent RNA helicase DeaD
MHTTNDDSVNPNEHDESSDETFAPGQDESADSASPLAVANFSPEVLPAPLRKALLTKGYAKLTQVQASVVHAKTGAKDMRISSQTGSGKTVAVGLALGRMLLEQGGRNARAINPGEDFDPRAPEILLLTPTRELAAQVKRELAWLFSEVPDAFVEVVTGGTSVGLERKSLARGPRMIVATPGRALDHLQNGGFIGKHISCVVLDEADQMLDMGFRDELKAILEELPGRKRTHLLSATFSGEVLRIAERYQSDVVRIEGTALGRANEDIEHVAHVVSMRHRYDALVNLLLKQHADLEDEEVGRALVFARTRADTLEFAERLQRDGLKAEPLSGDLAQAQRTRTLAAFRSGRVQVLVATDVAARGIDVQGVDLVIHLDPPGDPDAFTHRSGRTGRAGRKGTSVMLLPPQARARMERMYRVAGVKPQWAPVPNADKIKKLYAKLGKRKLFAALDLPADPEQLEYAIKLVAEHPPEQVVARLLEFVRVEPPCPPREISEHFAAEGRSAERKKGGDVRRGPYQPEGQAFRSERGSGGYGGPGFGGGPGFAGRGRPRVAERAPEQEPWPPRPKFRGPGQEQEPRFPAPRPEQDGARGPAPRRPGPAAPGFAKKAKRFR